MSYHTLTIDQRLLLRRVAITFNVGELEIVRSGRAPHISSAKQAFYLLLKESGLSYPRIAKRMGLKDHTTALYWVRKARASEASDPLFAARMELLRPTLLQRAA